mgnify:CR=1 FL=1
MNLLNKLSMNSIKLNKRRSIAIITGIMLAVALLTAVSSMVYCGYYSLLAYEKNTKGDHHVVIYDVSESEAVGYEAIDGVDSVWTDEGACYIKMDRSGLMDYNRTLGDILGISEAAADYLMGDSDYSDEEYEAIMTELGNIEHGWDINTTLMILEADPLKESALKIVIYMGIAAALVVILTSIYCIRNSFDISITERIRQYGMLSSVGATGRQIRKNVFFEAFVLGAAGLLLGLCLGVLAEYILVRLTDHMLFETYSEGFHVYFVISPLAIFAALLMGVITIYFSARKSAVRASKISPINAIRNIEDIKADKKKLKIPGWVERRFGTPGVISYKSTKRSKKRFRTSQISIVVSVVVFISSVYFASMTYDTLESAYDWDYSVSASIDCDDAYEVMREIASYDEVEAYSLVRSLIYDVSSIDVLSDDYKEYAGSDDYDITAAVDVRSVGDEAFGSYCEKLGLDADEVTDNKEGIYIFAPSGSRKDEIIVATLDAKAGDVVTGRIDHDYYGLDEDDTGEMSVSIAAVTSEFPIAGKAWGGHEYIVVSDSFMDELTARTGANSTVMGFFATDSASKLYSRIDDTLSDLSYDEGVGYAISNLEESYNAMKMFLLTLGIFLFGFILVVMLIGLTNIYNTINTGIELRKSEFAALFSVGMTPKQFEQMIRLESMFVGAKALAIGIPVSVLISVALYVIMVSSADDPSALSYRPPVLEAVISIIVVIGLL